MSQEEVERVYTINLGKVLLSPRNQRAKRAINMMREFATRHMKSENVKIEEDVSHLIWSRGIRHPPRKIRVKLTKDEDGMVLISKYQEEITKTKKEEKAEEKAKQKKVEEAEEKKATEKAEKAEEKSAKKKTEEKPTKTAEKTEKAKEEKVKKEKSEKVKEKPKESKSNKKAKKK
ncbi:MAG: 60S ribosomal protein L31 [Thaumarchaeota archaeon]|nr:60S ribosomal protein L31 [Nitrososphaerota archaeon]